MRKTRRNTHRNSKLRMRTQRGGMTWKGQWTGKWSEDDDAAAAGPAAAGPAAAAGDVNESASQSVKEQELLTLTQEIEHINEAISNKHDAHTQATSKHPILTAEKNITAIEAEIIKVQTKLKKLSNMSTSVKNVLQKINTFLQQIPILQQYIITAKTTAATDAATAAAAANGQPPANAITDAIKATNIEPVTDSLLDGTPGAREAASATLPDADVKNIVKELADIKKMLLSITINNPTKSRIYSSNLNIEASYSEGILLNKGITSVTKLIVDAEKSVNASRTNAASNIQAEMDDLKQKKQSLDEKIQAVMDSEPEASRGGRRRRSRRRSRRQSRRRR